MGVLSFLKTTFLPSAQEAADRRLAVFGTTSKIPAIITAGVAGAVIATPFLREAAISTVVKHPVTTLLGTAVVAGGGLKLVGPAFTTTKKATEVAVPIITGEKKITDKDFSDVAKTVGIIAGVGALGTAVGIIGSKVLGKEDKVETMKEAIVGSSVGFQPIIPDTQTITTGRKAYKRRTTTKTPSLRQSVRVNIINNPVTTGLRITNKRFINERILN